ncbi:MAG: hypothetical protein QXY74_03625, partial [Candidatus Bathyarchaeia archaeon]
YPNKMTTLEPYLSVILPTIGIEKPVLNMQRLMAWPSKDISQPSSLDIDISETGKDICAPEAIKNIAKLKLTTTQPQLLDRLKLIGKLKSPDLIMLIPIEKYNFLMP